MIAYVNGRYVLKKTAMISIDDRACQFADAVYDAIAVFNGILIDEALHLARLEYSLKQVSIALPVKIPVLKMILRRILSRNQITSGLLYMQVSRGVAPRDHLFPAHQNSSLIITVKAIGANHFESQKKGVAVVSKPDLRWKRPDIKTTNLLPNCLAKQQAFEVGAKEAWLLDEKNYVTEGCSTNAWIITKDNILLTHPADQFILKGITRQTVLKLAEEAGISYQERPFHIEEAYQAKEAFLTSALHFVTPVVKIDDKICATGKVGLFSKKLMVAYDDYISTATHA